MGRGHWDKYAVFRPYYRERLSCYTAMCTTDGQVRLACLMCSGGNCDEPAHTDPTLVHTTLTHPACRYNREVTASYTGNIVGAPIVSWVEAVCMAACNSNLLGLHI